MADGNGNPKTYNNKKTWFNHRKKMMLTNAAVKKVLLNRFLSAVQSGQDQPISERCKYEHGNAWKCRRYEHGNAVDMSM